MMKSILVSIMVGLMLFAAGVPAQGFQEGVQYVPVQPQPPVAEGDEVEVVEVFRYGCPACMSFDPIAKAWASQQPSNVVFRQMPYVSNDPRIGAKWRETFRVRAQLYYALESMGELERLHGKVFEAIHNEGVKLENRDQVRAFVVENGIDATEFDRVMDSFAVAAKVNRSLTLTRRFGVSGVPSVVVDGRYRNGEVRTWQEMTEVIDHLVAKVLEQRSQQAKAE